MNSLLRRRNPRDPANPDPAGTLRSEHALSDVLVAAKCLDRQVLKVKQWLTIDFPVSDSTAAFASTAKLKAKDNSVSTSAMACENIYFVRQLLMCESD